MIRTSVLINTHNHAAYVAEAVQSVLEQSVPADEVIVYDDASTDGTVARLRAFGDRIRLIAGARTGRPGHLAQARAVETAFAASTGDLVFLLDGDDRFKPGKIARYRAAFAAHPDASLVHAPMDKIDPQGRRVGTTFEPRKHVAQHLVEIYRQHDVDFYYPTSALAFSRRYLAQMLPVDFSDGQPLWLDTRLSITAPYFGPVITLPDACTDWRRHPASDSIRVRTRQLQLRQTLMRARIFNRFCRDRRLRPIQLWRNRRFYWQLLRYGTPDSLYTFYYDRVRPALSRRAASS